MMVTGLAGLGFIDKQVNTSVVATATGTATVTRTATATGTATAAGTATTAATASTVTIASVSTMSFMHTGVLPVIETMVARILQIFRSGSLAYGCTDMPRSFLQVVA
jgi:hypothetical protein